MRSQPLSTRRKIYSKSRFLMQLVYHIIWFDKINTEIFVFRHFLMFL